MVRFLSFDTILQDQKVNLILDVGANAGQYGSRLRRTGYQGKIVSFEPQKQPFGELSEKARQDGNWTTVNVGLGREDGQATINLYGDSCLGSMLQMDQSNYESKPSGTETIDIRTLDGVFDQYVTANDRVWLKMDTQGFEKQVLAGAEQSLSRIIGVQMEMSLTPIYDDQPHLDEMIALLRAKGFMLWQLQRGLCNLETSREMECDGIFIHHNYVKN